MRDTQLQYTVSVVFPIQFARLDHLSVCMLHFPLPLCSIFDTAIDNKIHNCFHISCCISHCHWVTTTAISWQLHTSLHNSPEYFPPPSTTESTSCSIVPSPTSKHSTFHISCCISHCHQLASTTCIDNTLHSSCCISHWHSLFALATTSKHNCFDYTILISCCIPPVVINHPRVVLLLIVQPANTTTTALTTPSSFRVTIPITISSLHVVHLANTTNSTFFSLFDFRKIHHPADQLSPAGLTSLKYTTKPTPCLTTPQINYPPPAWLP